MRLQRFMALCGVASRRESEKIIAQGRVHVGGCQAKVGDSVDPETDEILLDGQPLHPDRPIYVLLNKPRGVITSVNDPQHRKTVIDCIAGVNVRVFPVGRLDLDVEGALLLTNDGELAYRLTHPKYQVDKVYLVWVEGVVTPATAAHLEKGVLLDDGETAPAEAVILQRGVHSTLLRLVLREGRKREVKRMCAAVGHTVRDLRRVSVGNVRLRGLKPGEWRLLSDLEVRQLRTLAGLDGLRKTPS